MIGPLIPALLVGVVSLPLPWSSLHAPAWVERWLYNPRERTERSIGAYRAGDAKAAMATADTALRLAGDDPLPRFNAGTAHLAGKDGKQAVELLDRAAAALEKQGAAPELAASAAYNLGNARLEAGDAAGAVEAYKRALHQLPSHRNAKHNLELALAEREKEKMRAKQPQDGKKNDQADGKEGESDRSPGQGKEPGQPQPGQQGEAGRSPEAPKTPQDGRRQPAPASPKGNPSRGQDQPLHGFQDQPEMSAREAAAVLQAVENLERQKRRQEALEQQKRRATDGRDW
jgi:hypothetical protein